MDDRSWTPQTLLELSNGYWRTCVLHAAVKLDLFSQLGDRALRADELAATIGADKGGGLRGLRDVVA
jgi:hypothetical protein